MSENRQLKNSSNSDGSEGFTLLETLIAFLVLSISIGVSMQVINTGLLKTKRSSEFSQILDLANRLRSLELYDENDGFPKSGETEEGLSWNIEPVVIGQNAEAGSRDKTLLFKMKISRTSDGKNAYEFVYIPNNR